MNGNSLREATRPVCDAARSHADETEAGRRLAPDVVEVFEASGLGAALAPPAIGGSGEDLRSVLEAIEAISVADASAGWCSAIGMGSNYLAALVPEGTARALFRDLRKGGAGPFAPGSMTMPNDSGGVHVAGRWSYASNCQQAGVLAAGVVLCDAAGPIVGPGGVELGLAFLGADDFSVVECWNMDGLRGTGSHDVVAELDLDADRVAPLWTPKWPDEALFRLRTFDVLGPCLAMVPLGIGRAALDVLRAKTVVDAAGEPRPGPRQRLADDPIAQLRVGQAELQLATARTMLLDLVGEAVDAGAGGDEPSRRTSALIGLACGQALTAGRDAVQTTTELLGSSAVRDDSPVNRLRRDVTAAGTHVMFSHHLRIGLGRELAGLPTSAFPFLPVVDT